MRAAAESSRSNASKHIGTLNESSLHARLKELYLEEGSATEVLLEGYVVDILRSNGDVVEIQTGSLSKLRGKLSALLARGRVILVYPLAVEKQLVVFDDLQRRVLYTRMSPRRPGLLEAFGELVGIAPLLGAPGFQLEVLLTREQEIRKADGRGSWRRRGITIVGRKLVEIRERVHFARPADYLALLPDGCPEEFTNRRLASLLGVGVRTAGQLSYCLRGAGVIAVRGKRGREYLFARTG